MSDQSNIPPFVIEIDSTFRGRYNKSNNFLPGNFEVQQTIQSRIDTQDLDLVSKQAPINYWRGANFKQNFISRPGNFNYTNYLCVKPIIPTSIITPLPNNELGFASENTILYIQANNSDGSGVPISDSEQNSLHTKSNYYVGAVIATIDSSQNINNRRRILNYKYLGNNNAVCTLDSPIIFDLSGITLAILDPTDFTNVNDPYIYIPHAPFLENHYSHFIDIDGNGTSSSAANSVTGIQDETNTNIIYNHCNFQHRPVKLKSYNKFSHVLQINTTTASENSESEGPIISDISANTWNPWDVYSIREQKPIVCGGMVKEEISPASIITGYDTIPLFLTTKTLADIYPPKRLPGLDSTNHKLTFNINPNLKKNILSPEVLGNYSNPAGAYLEIMPLRCVDSSNSEPIYTFDVSLSDTGNIYNKVNVDPSANISDFVDFYRSCKLRFSVSDSSGLPIYSNPFYGAERVITAYDGSGKTFTIFPGIYDSSFESYNYKASIICDHSCELPQLPELPELPSKKQFVRKKPNDFRRINSLIYLEGLFGQKNGDTFKITVNESFNNLSNLTDSVLKSSLSQLYIMDISMPDNVNLNMIKKVITVDNILKEITFTCYVSSYPNWGDNLHNFIISSGKAITPFNYNLGNQNFCLLNVTNNYFNRIDNQSVVCDNCCSYRITLCDVVLPNIVLDSYFGGRISAYRYFYVVLNNLNETGTGISRPLRTNNKFTKSGVHFRVAVERQFTDESSKYFLSFTAKCPMYSKFNPTKTMRFSIILPNGETFKNASKEWYPPCKPNPLIQISASFMFERLSKMGNMKSMHRHQQKTNESFTRNYSMPYIRQ